MSGQRPQAPVALGSDCALDMSGPPPQALGCNRTPDMSGQQPLAHGRTRPLHSKVRPHLHRKCRNPPPRTGARALPTSHFTTLLSRTPCRFSSSWTCLMTPFSMKPRSMTPFSTCSGLMTPFSTCGSMTPFRCCQSPTNCSAHAGRTLMLCC